MDSFKANRVSLENRKNPDILSVRVEKVTADINSPSYGKPGDLSEVLAAGLDLYSAEDITVHSYPAAVLKCLTQGWTKDMFDEYCKANNIMPKINMNIKVEIPEGYAALLIPRSGLFSNKSLIQTNSIGLIDASFREPWLFPVRNDSPFPITIKKNEKLCQILFIKRTYLEIEYGQVERISNHTGFNSTGGYIK